LALTELWLVLNFITVLVGAGYHRELSSELENEPGRFLKPRINEISRQLGSQKLSALPTVQSQDGFQTQSESTSGYVDGLSSLRSTMGEGPEGLGSCCINLPHV
jgi:hypothetical protein